MLSSIVPKTETELRAERSSMNVFAAAVDTLRATVASDVPDRIAHLPTPSPETDDDDDDEDDENERGSGDGNIDPEEDEGWSDDDDDDDEEPLQTSGGRSPALSVGLRE
jgi:hypothetical protein